MSRFEFTKTRIDQYVIGIGVDVTRPIELALDALRIQEFYNQVQEFYNQVSSQYPGLFADLSQSKSRDRTEFQISKKIPLPGKNQEISVPTFMLTPRGPVFNFPITLPDLLEDYEWSKQLNTDVIACLEIFHSHLPATEFVRIGKVRSLVFHCDDSDGCQIFRKHFCPNAPEGAQELSVGWNDPDDRYNRKLMAKVVQKPVVVSQAHGNQFHPGPVPKVQQIQHGIEVTFDVNNISLNKSLDGEQMMIILNHADELYETYLYGTLSEG